MHNPGMNAKPLTPKELEYITDSLSNEDLLLKQCAATAACIAQSNNAQALSSMVQVHQQHMSILLNALQHHTQMAPTHPQQSNMQQ
ncbi:hypothetical protein [Paenibacillus marinisediminis]